MKFQCAANKRKHTIKEPVAGMSWLRFHTWILRRGGTRSKSLLRQGFFLQRQTRIRGMMLAPFTKSMCHESLSRVFPACTYSRKYLDFNIIFNWFDPATILRICVRVYCICARMRFSLSLFSLSRCLAVPLSHCHTAWLSVYLSICLSVYLSVYLSVCPSVRQSSYHRAVCETCTGTIKALLNSLNSDSPRWNFLFCAWHFV